MTAASPRPAAEQPASADARGLLIINADDWGGWKSATDAAVVCVKAGRVSSVSAMVFMEDSERGAALADSLGVDVGLHINFNQSFTGTNCPQSVVEAHECIRRFLRRSKVSQLLYNPWLRDAFRIVYQAQVDEFCRLYKRVPSHFDGHQHMHLCANMIWDGVIPRGQKLRRSFSFWPGEKSLLNRAYRSWVDGRLERRYVVPDYFFSLWQCMGSDRLSRVTALAKVATVELMTHPEKNGEQEFLVSDKWRDMIAGLNCGSYSELPAKSQPIHRNCACQVHAI